MYADVASVREKRLRAESYEPTATLSGVGPPCIAASGSTSERVGSGFCFMVPDSGDMRLIREN